MGYHPRAEQDRDGSWVVSVTSDHGEMTKVVYRDEARGAAAVYRVEGIVRFLQQHGRAGQIAHQESKERWFG